MGAFSVVVVTAGPPGQRSESGLPVAAQVKIDGREILLRSVELFLNRDHVKQVLLAFSPEMMEEAKRRFGAHLGFSGVKLVAGGPGWIDQIAAAEPAIHADATHVIVHDAARPAVPAADIDALTAAADAGAQAAVLVAPLRASLLEVDEGRNGVGVRSASDFVQLLTPQVFTRQAFGRMAQEKVEPHASQWTLVNGSPLNLRVSGNADASLAKAMIGLLPKPKVKPLSSPFEEAQW